MDESRVKKVQACCRRTPFFLILLSLVLGSCAKLGYIVEQGIGQMSLQLKGRDNQKVLEDETVAAEAKHKIQLIQKYKLFYEKYFDREFKNIYEKTTFLDREAVSYMVTASPMDKIAPYQVSFPFVGSFPYLAFFKKKSALKFSDKLQAKGYMTWMRPVYAYSSLNYFDDRILSSFFVYDDFELAELIFHELTHLLLFIKDDVAFNESLAQYIAHKMIREYFTSTGGDFLKRRQASRELSKELVPQIQQLNDLYHTAETSLELKKVFEHFFKKELAPRLKSYCQKQKQARQKCTIDQAKWNNARLVAYLNYEGRYEAIEAIHKESQTDLRSFIELLKEAESQYRDQEGDASRDFLSFLKNGFSYEKK